MDQLESGVLYTIRAAVCVTQQWENCWKAVFCAVCAEKLQADSPWSQSVGLSKVEQVG
jgi:hypothetical protein